MMRSRMKWRNVAYLAMLVIATALIIAWWPQLSHIWRGQGLTFGVAVLLMMMGTLIQTQNFIEFLDEPGTLRVWGFSRIWALSALANYVAPLQPGIAVRVTYLSRQGVKVATSLLATWRQLCVSVWMALAGLATGLLLTDDARGRWPALLLSVAWLMTMMLRRVWLSTLDRLRRPEWLARHRQLLHNATTGISLQGIAGIVAQYILGAVLLYWVYSRFGAPIDVGQAMLMACAVYVSTLLAIMPGNLGVMEAIYMVAGHGFGLTVADAGALAILIRAGHIGANLLLLMVGTVVHRRDE